MEPARNFHLPDFQAFISHYFHSSAGCMVIIHIHIRSINTIKFICSSKLSHNLSTKASNCRVLTTATSPFGWNFVFLFHILPKPLPLGPHLLLLIPLLPMLLIHCLLSAPGDISSMFPPQALVLPLLTHNGFLQVLQFSSETKLYQGDLC